MGRAKALGLKEYSSGTMAGDGSSSLYFYLREDGRFVDGVKKNSECGDHIGTSWKVSFYEGWMFWKKRTASITI